jgi:isoquinoline 1-oxidoreductase
MKDTTRKDSVHDNGTKDSLLSRRNFLKATGGGVIIFLAASILPAQERGRGPASAGRELPTDFNAYLKIGADGRVSCFTGKVELGQGITTSLAQMLADELDVPLDRVDMVMGDTDLCPWDMGTFGSRTTRFFGPPLLQAAAEARSILLDLAAEHLKVPKARLSAKDGAVFDTRNKDSQVTYGQLAQGKYIERRLTAKASIKQVAERRAMGKPERRTDAAPKVTGQARYAGDIRLPGMLYAAILRPPAHGATLKRVDTSALKEEKEIVLVQDGDLVAVLHPYPDVAEKALSRIKAEYDTPTGDLDYTTIFKHLLDVAPDKGDVVSEAGNLKEGEGLAVKTFEETYFDHYVAHACLETHTATVKIEGDKVTVWASTQTPFAAKEEIARALDIPAQKVRVMPIFVGGGFGGKTYNKQTVEAARLAKLTGRPVQLMWTRKEEFFHDTFQPAAIVKIKSGLSGGGRIVFWQFDTYYSGPRGAEQFYAIPHHRVTSIVHYTGMAGAHPFKTGAWRAPGNNTNTFARESHIDMMAARIGEDPVQFRMNNLTDRRMITTLKAAAAQFQWKKAISPSGRGYGVACATDAGACVVTMAEVDVDRVSGTVKVKRILCAQDMGFVINPEGARLQMEGGLTMGLGYALSEEVSFKGGRILTANFDTYEIPRFSWLPTIETILVDNPAVAPQGGGEPPITCVGAVIANAIFDATGARMYTMPMMPARVKEAMAKVGAR